VTEVANMMSFSALWLAAGNGRNGFAPLRCYIGNHSPFVAVFAASLPLQSGIVPARLHLYAPRQKLPLVVDYATGFVESEQGALFGRRETGL
jgi:hypothetical protein